MNDRALIPISERPVTPSNWDYDDSVQKVKQFVYKWKTLTVELFNELWVAREKLSIPPQQARIVSRNKSSTIKTWSDYCEDIGSSRQVVNRWLQKVFDNGKRLPPTSTDLPVGKYQIIYADPPWDFKGQQHNGNHVISSATNHYNTMTLDELKALNIGSIADTDCLLFMWVVSPCLDDGIELMTAWGFEYITVAFVWDKQVTNPSNYTLSQCELCLLGKMGKIPQPRGSRAVKQFLSERRTTHSTKPDEIRNRIAEMFPHHHKIELFARKRCSGWDVWGDEVGKYN